MAKAPGLVLRGWLALTWALQPLLPLHLKRRLKRGKESPERWREKLGYASASRPDGPLIWLHAVGLGEVLALRSLITRMLAQNEGLNFLVTSGTRASAEVFARNLPPRTIHQFAPLDAPGPARRFLSHWRPDLSIWAEQELWPGLIFRTHQAGIPLALVNARMNQAAFARRSRVASLYHDILPRFDLISAQDAKSAEHLAALGAPVVRTDGSLKPASPALIDHPEARKALQAALKNRMVWLVASSHSTDEALALATHATLLKSHPGALLVLAPRLPERAPEIRAATLKAKLTVAQRSRGEAIEPNTQVYLADTFGELGLFYRLAPAAFIGGTTNDVEGHNPWEAARLGCAILHGPRTANFANDYAELNAADAARMTDQPDILAAALTDPALTAQAANATALINAHMDRIDQLCHKLSQLT